jgi:hypothetical protein
MSTESTNSAYTSFSRDAYRGSYENLDDPASTTVPQESTNCFGWLVSKFKESCSPLATLKGAAIAVSSTATVVFGAFSAYEYVNHGYSSSTASWTAAAAGGTAIIASQIGLPAVVSDFMARWSFETGQIETQGLMNGFCPLESCALWDLDNPPDGVKFAMATTYYFTASASLGLRLRPLFFQTQISSEILPLIDKRKGSNRLFLESTTELGVRFGLEQLAKGVVAASVAVPAYIWMQEGPVSKMMIGTGLMLASSIPGSVLTSMYTGYEQKQSDLAKLPGQSETTIRNLRRFGQAIDIIASVGIGALTSIRSPYAFIPIGFCMSVKKILEQKRFEDLAANPDRVMPFDWKDISLYAKGAMLLASMTWYGIGLSDSTNSVNDRVFVSLMFAGAFAGYPMQRKLMANFNPRSENAFLNSAAFYTTYFPIAPYPYIVRRFAGRLADSNPPADIAQTIMDGIAWFTWGLGWATQRARYGVREDASPADVPLQQQIWAGRVLTSGAHFDA